jgi:sec-independent protein translocase protein TatA
MGMPGGMELFALIAVIVLLFGGKKIPELAKGLGQGIKNFKSAVKEDEQTTEVTSKTQKIETEATTTTSSDAVEEKTEPKTTV